MTDSHVYKVTPITSMKEQWKSWNNRPTSKVKRAANIKYLPIIYFPPHFTHFLIFLIIFIVALSWGGFLPFDLLMLNLLFYGIKLSEGKYHMAW